MNKSESKYFNTALLMDEALIKLLAEKDIEFISVKEICEKAGVNRSTFYLHYETIGELLEEAIGFVTSRFLATFNMTEALFDGRVEDVPLSRLIFTNEKYLKPDAMYSGMKKHVLEPIMKRFEIPVDEQNYRGRMLIPRECLSKKSRN